MMNRISIIVAADANRVERIWPSVTGIAESSWCVVKGSKRGSMIYWGNISETRMKPLRRPVATSNGEVAGCGRCLLAFRVYDGMRFQKLGGWKGYFAPWMEAYESGKTSPLEIEAVS